MTSLAAPTRRMPALERAREGRGISRAEALLLMESCELDALLEAAAAIRDQSKGRKVSFSKKVFIPLTHLCRDYCGYCTFRSDPLLGAPAYMSPEEVLAAAEAGRKAGCKEALFSLGDQPERVFPEARDFLRRFGCETTLEYLAAMSELVLKETGLLPHSNPGVMGEADLCRLKESNISMGLMLEVTSTRLLGTGLAHWQAPDKAPAVRLRTIRDAGKQRVACTTGILVGIGERFEDRVDSLFAIRHLHEEYGHIQEVIVQPFRAKAGTRMAASIEPSMEELLRTLAFARLILGPEMNLQSPPNLVSEEFPRLLEAGINDWGGISPVTKDFINPEAAWPEVPVLAAGTVAAGFTLRERLAIYPEFSARPEFVGAWLRGPLAILQADDGYARAEGPAC